MSDHERSFRYISEADSIFKKEKETDRKKSSLEAFGEEDAARYREAIQNVKDAEAMENALRGLDRCRHHVGQWLVSGNGAKIDAAAALFLESMDDPGLNSEIEHLLSKPGSLPVREASDLMSDKTKISDDLFVRMLEYHAKVFKEKVAAFELEKQSLVEHFRNGIRAAIESGVVHFDLSLIEERLSQTSIWLHDPLHNYHPGYFNKEQSFVAVSALLDQDGRRDTSEHEFVHASIEGAISTLESDGQFKSVKVRRKGLASSDSMRRNNSNTWFTEALTEKIKRKVFGQKRGDSYSDEIAEVDRLIEAGVPERYFFDAYAESFDPERDRAMPLPAWNGLLLTIRKKQGQGALGKIGKRFENKSYH